MGVSEHKILKVTSIDHRYKQFNAKFTNKAYPRPVNAKDIQTQHQIDLVDLNDLQLGRDGKCYQHILSLMNVFSRYQWLEPLEQKKPSHIVTHLKIVHNEHDLPKNLQSDRRNEFQKDVTMFCKKSNIRKMCSRAYHIQSQG